MATAKLVVRIAQLVVFSALAGAFLRAEISTMTASTMFVFGVLGQWTFSTIAAVRVLWREGRGQMIALNRMRRSVLGTGARFRSSFPAALVRLVGTNLETAR